MVASTTFMPSVDKCTVKTAPREPLTIPQMSPITSLQMLDTLLLFFNNLRQDDAPFIFFAFIAWNGASLAVIVATPIISNMIPIEITTNKITVKTITLKLDK